MNLDRTARIGRAAAAAASLTLALSPAAGARVYPVGEPRPLPQQQVRPVANTLQHPHPMGPRVLYGMITAINGQTLSLRLRSGRNVVLNAATAIENGEFSGPLFVGKLVCVNGVVSAGKFSADHITRLSNLNALPNDR